MLITIPELIANARINLRCLDAETAIRESHERQGTIIDVREPEELEADAAPGSINIPRGVLEMKVTSVVSEAGHPIYIHCASGGRATLAAEQLERMGFSNVTVITCPVTLVRQHLDALVGK